VKVLVLCPCFEIWGSDVWALKPWAIASSSLGETGWTTLTLLPRKSWCKGAGAIGGLDMSNCDPSSYLTDLLKVTGGLTRFGLSIPFLRELFRGAGLLLSGEEVSHSPFARNGFCFFASAEVAKLPLALRLRLPLLCAISEDCKMFCD
jgi:hypothetical protein